MKYLSVLLVLCGSVAMIVSGCKNSSDMSNPSIVTVPVGFSVTPGSLRTSSDPSPMDFSTSTTDDNIDTIYAILSSAVSWNVDMVGLTSGATKRISGLSSVVAAPWNGGHDGIYFFKANEKVKISLSFYGTDLTVLDTVSIGFPKRYHDVDSRIVAGSPVPSSIGVKITDFEVGNIVLPPSWYNFHDPTGSPGVPGHDAEQDSNTVSSSNFINPVQGYQYYYFEGTDRPALNSSYSTFFIMGAGFQQGTPVLANIPNINPDSLYFNIYVYGFGLPNTKFQVGFDEDDNSDGTWLNSNEDELVYIMRVDWVGWRLITFKYTDAKFSNIDPNGGAHGNKIHEPSKVIKMGFVMNTDPALQHAKVAFDFPCFTYGHPFNPNN